MLTRISRHYYFCHLLSVIVFVVFPHCANSDDLALIYERALQEDPTIKEARSLWQAAYEAKPQALSLLLPEITASAQYNDESFSGTNIFLSGIDDGMGNIVPTLASSKTESDSETLGWQVALTQPLFYWGRFAALDGAKKVLAKADVEYQLAEQQLILRVVSRYFDVLSAYDNQQAATDTLTAFARRLQQAQAQFEVGTIAVTDVHEARAAHDQAQADEIAAARRVNSAQEQLREIIGYVPNSLARPKNDLPLDAPSPADQEEWLNQALAGNLSLLSAQLNADIARSNIKIQQADRLPSLDLVASYDDFDRNATQTNDNITGRADTDGETTAFGITFQVPLFTSGRITSEIREAKFLHQAANDRLIGSARKTERDTRDAYLGVVSEISQVEALKQATISAEIALQATEQGLDVGTRTMVDVLAARRSFSNARTAYLRSRYDYLINTLQLKLAVGSLASDDVSKLNQWLEE